MLVYGPVPSRRLGRSLGVNTIPPKACSYACIYCQVGRTTDLCCERRAFHDPRTVVDAVRDRLDAVRAAGEVVDHVSVVPDGEPTLDASLGEILDGLAGLGPPVAVITNGSLLARADVRRDLGRADWVSVKVDTVDPRTWRRLNRPHGRCDLAGQLGGLLTFAGEFKGFLATETMLVADLNDTAAHAAATGEFLGRVGPAVAHVSIPTRPPARRRVRAADSTAVVRCHEIFLRSIPRVELLLGYEGHAFSATGDAAQNLLAITAVHPMREEAVNDLLVRAGASWDLVSGLVASRQLTLVQHDGHRYLVHRAGRAD